MDDLLPHYERELAFLRQQTKRFAQQYPKVAGRLQVSSEIAEDPHVERMIESFALLTSRIHKRLDDDFPLFTESFLEVLYPHYLRPMPSASIVHFDIDGKQSQMSAPAVVPRGTMLQSHAVRGVNCRFRTCAEVTLLPMALAGASYRSVVSAPTGTRLPEGATSVLSLRFELQSSQIRFDSLGIDHLRLYLDGEAAVVSALREALATRVVGLMPQFDEIDPWGPALTGAVCNAPALPRLAGFGEDEALLELDARSHPAYRLLTEYFGFPEKFSFIDLPWPRSALVGSARRSFTLHVLFAQIHGDSDQSRLMEGVVPRQLVMSCAPVVNLFTQHADPIRMTHQRTAYPLVVDARHAFAHEVYSIDKVYHVQQTPQGESVAEFQPLYSLHHATLDEGGRYWYAHRDESMAQHSPGHELQLSIVDDDFDPVEPQSDTLSVEVTATNRDLPTLLGSGHPSGDLSMDGGSVAQAIRLLRKPTPSTRFQRGRGTLWRLISHLSVNHLSLASGGVDALREMLRLYELNRGGGTRRQVDGIKALEYRPATAWLPGQPFATFVRGVEVRMTLEEEAFVGSGLAVFVQVMDRFFGLCVNTNCFTRLVVLSADSGEELFKCAPRSGDSPLL